MSTEPEVRAVKWASALALAMLLALPLGRPQQALSAAAGGTLEYGLRDAPDRLDPNLTGLRPSQIVYFQIFDTLIIRDKRDNSFRPWLATRWSISPDGKAYTFDLRKDVRFHDGSAFDAAAVKFNFDRTHNPALASRAGGIAAGFYDHADVVNASTVRIVLKEPWAPFLDAVSLYYRMVSPAAVGQFGDQDFGRHPSGTGPFRFVEWVPNDHITLARNPDYNWAPSNYRHQSVAYLQQIVFRLLPEDGTRVAALENGEVQVIDNAPPQDFDRLTKTNRFRALLGFAPGVPFVFALNVTKAPTDELAVRQAMEYGIDRPTIVKTAFGPYQRFGAFKPAYGVLTPYTFGYDKHVRTYEYDPTRARALLEGAGWKVGLAGIREKAGERLTIPLGSWDHGVPELMQAQLREIGVELKVIITTPIIVNENQRKGITLMSPLPAPRSDPDILSHFLHSREVGGGGFNFSFVKDPALDRALNSQASEIVQKKRLALLGEAQQLTMDKAYLLPVYDWDNVSLASSKVHDFEFNNLGFFPNLHDVWLSAQ